MTLLLKVLQTAALLLGCGLLILVGWATWDLKKKVDETAPKVDALLDKGRQTLTEVNRLTLEGELTAKNLREASKEWSTASKQQTQMIARTGERVDALLADSDALVRRTDESLNGKIGPQVAGLLGAANGMVNEGTTAVGKLSTTISDADRVVIKVGGSAATAASNLAVVTDNLTSTSRHVESTSETIDAYVKRITAPANTFWKIFKSLLWTSAEAVTIVK